MKKVNQDPFSNGSEHRTFEAYNCDRCIKSSEPREEGTRYTNADENNMPKCSIQRDIVVRMFCDEPIKQKTIDICRDFTLHGTLCPYIKTERPKRKKVENNKQTLLSL